MFIGYVKTGSDVIKCIPALFSDYIGFKIHVSNFLRLRDSFQTSMCSTLSFLKEICRI